MKGFKALKSWRNDRRPLVESNSNDIQDVPDLIYDNTLTQNTLNTHEERGQQSEEQITPPITLQEAAHLLGVAPDALTSEDGPLCSMRPDLNAERPVVHLMQISVDQHFPKTPADVDQNLQRHLLNVQDAVREQLVRLDPRLHSEGLIQCYHRQIFEHLDDLLQNISSSQNHLLLIKWVLQTYLSQDLLGHPGLQYTDPIKKVDLLLFTQWVSRAEEQFLKNVETENTRFLENILQNERSHEAQDELYVDTIQCIDAMPREALKISSKLSDQAQEVCLRELLTFLTRYRDKQTDILAKTAKMNKPETKQFFKTLNNCKELKQHIHTKAIQTKESSLKDIITKAVAMLENMEAFTLKLLKEIIADIVESHLKKYFKSDNREFLYLIDEVKRLLSELSDYQDVQTRVMDEAYKLIAHIYFKRLIKISQRKLRKSWHPDVGQEVAKDAEHLHSIISYLVPGVGQWNVMLLKVGELLDCKSLVATKMTVASMQKECYTWSEDLELLPALLQWKGLSRWEIGEVQNVLEDLPGFQPRPKTASCFTRLLSCCTRESTATS
ncbi:exocyst complex component 3 isoform X1 [Anarrhichthys ocellatus]|uniref:exocyst complex component 3 isoform X1 n=1 Tax=Anarrhichthys ocellatus TaxID=433405 RepID=UPI0012EE67BE|nr:exocyst complex component 3-like isoform X1 [Anarrhichthys ocellatus]